MNEKWVYELIDVARRAVMDLYGGNLDHPALDHLEAASAQVALTAAELKVERRIKTGPVNH